MPVNLHEKTIPSSATLLTLALVTLWSTRPVRAQNTCVSLASSKACPAFDQYYVGLPGLADRYSYMANVTDVASFDESLFAYVKTTGDYLLPLGCNSDYGNGAPYARYSLSRICAGLIQDVNNSLPCNYEHNLTPPPLCKTTCDAWISSIETITSDTSVCQDSVLRNNTISNLQNQCASWQGYNGTASESCISGSVNEPGNCGTCFLWVGICSFADLVWIA
ncbi:hypothetical protein BDB00DRAFT_769863 [Zychaea mexicana]|uniref:uncharacterized protein n=1 Tax=Zychaea mexicana TaxID=64656 RepID=UPI0022FF1722|nr:uncharacterized protein BDB00DRAFT_769863 [Zychaea mexicana]KAI9489822.1 hypothetical protein BDB00DRAFT_769863 [Zychaea mexicana]